MTWRNPAMPPYSPVSTSRPAARVPVARERAERRPRRTARSCGGPSAPRRRGCPTRARTRCAPTPGWLLRQRLPERVARPQPRTAAPSDRSSGSPICARSATPKPCRSARMQDSRSALPDRSPMPLTHVLIHASCPAVQVAERAGDRVGHGHAEVVVAVRLDRHARPRWRAWRTARRSGRACRRRWCRSSGPGRRPPPCAASANSVRNPSSVREPSSALTPTVCTPAALAARTAADHLRDDGVPVEPAAELVRAASGPTWRSTGCSAAARAAAAFSTSPATARHQPDSRRSPNAPRLGQRDLRPHVGHLVEQEREADLGLGHAEPAQIEVDHRLAELRQPGPGGLHAVAVGDVKEVNLWHASRG